MSNLIRFLAITFLGVLPFLTGCAQPGLHGVVAGKDDAERRSLFAQIVDEPNAPLECGVLEGSAYRYMLSVCVETLQGRYEGVRSKEATYQNLNRRPDLYRGHWIRPGGGGFFWNQIGVVVEMEQCALTPETGLPAGFSLLRAIFICRPPPVAEVYELRIVCGPGSDLANRLWEGIKTGRNPELRLHGYFFKCYARLTNRPGEAPWRRPMLVVPENAIETYGAFPAQEDVERMGILPTRPVGGPKADERLVVELRRGRQESEGNHHGVQHAAEVRVGDHSARLGGHGELFAEAAREFKARLPKEQVGSPSAVILIRRGASPDGLPELLRSLEALGFGRLFVKDENETPAVSAPED